ncbi:MAG: lactate utilization protein LutB domain-containing protein, partial [Terriglobia bacterium]
VCPVKINIPDLLLHLRGKAQRESGSENAGHAPRGERASMRFWAWIMKNPRAYALGGSLARIGQKVWARGGWMQKVPFFPVSRWTDGRDFPALAAQTFRERWKKGI